MIATKLTDTIYLEKSEIEKDLKKQLIAFLNGDKNTEFEKAFEEFVSLLTGTNWIELEDDLCYDHKIKACWYELCNEKIKYNEYKSGIEIKEILQNFKSKYNLDLPTLTELKQSLTNIKEAPFKLSDYKRPYISRNILYKINNISQGYDCDYDELRNKDAGSLIPLLRLTTQDNFSISNRQAFFRFLSLNLIPKKLDQNSNYIKILKIFHQYKIEIEDFFTIKSVKLKDSKQIKLSADFIIKKLLEEDKIRADITPYDKKMLEDIEQGHWSLWEDGKNVKNPVKATLKEKLVARNPASFVVKGGVVGIDFGTKSTVVVYQKDSIQTLPMRIGIGDMSQKIEPFHYENPTIMECNNLKEFLSDYKAREGRPFTKWSDLTISHTANNNLLSSNSEYYNAYITQLKQWAGTKTKKLKIKDKQGYVIDLPEYANLGKDDFDPIEVYAYYLGLYINNMYNGIYLNYILSFPVTYEVGIREKILKSFEKGIKKSLPQTLHNLPEVMSEFKISQGASEPAAYATIALQEYEFEPRDSERIFYGVFDFGGGTTDFDFGIFREAQGKKERRYDYTIEHFGAGGDRYLGGENLLELLAFEVFKKNKDKLLQNSIQFTKPAECREFLGSERLLSNSREANKNTKALMEKLRAFWEDDKEKAKDYESGVIEVNLLDIEATQHTKFELDISKEELENILKERIQKGVKNFFNSLREVLSDDRYDFSDIKEINIFLAGNSSKSKIVKELFDKEILAETEKFKKEGIVSNNEQIFKLFAPLSNEDDYEKPNGKTGVAFGLLETRKSGNIYVIDHNLQENEDKKEINFKYYLGKNRRKKFKVIIDRDTPYNKWVEFIDASVDTFEVYYSSSPMVTTNSVNILDNNIKKLMLNIDIEDEDAFVYIRLVSPNEFEYVVAYKDKIEDKEYLTKIKKVSL